MTKQRRISGFAIRVPDSGYAFGVRFKRRWLTCEVVWKPLPVRFIVRRTISQRVIMLLMTRSMKRIKVILVDNFTPAMRRAGEAMVEFHKALGKARLLDA